MREARKIHLHRVLKDARLKTKLKFSLAGPFDGRGEGSTREVDKARRGEKYRILRDGFPLGLEFDSQDDTVGAIHLEVS